MSQPITHILETALYAPNLEETAAFYEQVLGLERLSAVAGRHVFYRLERQMLLLFDPAASTVPPPQGAIEVPPHGTRGEGHVCFDAAPLGIEAWAERLERAGVEIERRIDWPQGGRSLYFRDPAGNSLEVAERRIWGLP
ncbi:MAG: VOC family protein [Pseudomonadota bacterium]